MLESLAEGHCVIRLGYEIGSGRAVDIPSDRHVAISGQTQRSGKTTTLEALIHRSGLRAVAFVTKRAEGSFRSAQPIAPYFRDSADWQFVSSILEAMLGERMKFERAWIIDACRGADGLADVMANVKKRLHGVAAAKRGKWTIKPAQGLNRSILTQLEAYLEIVIPQIQRLPYTKRLELVPGLNVMDLSEYSTELQQLVIRSVLEWVYERERNTVVIIPEAWEFIPQNRRSPVLLAAEELIRKGAAAGNYVWLDSQDIAGVHKNVLRSVGVWILGVQRELNEVRRTLGYVQGAGKIKPEDVMSLARGQFFAAWDQRVARVYVQPFWISDAHAAAIARGEEDVASAEKIWREQRAKKPETSQCLRDDHTHTPEERPIDSPQVCSRCGASLPTDPFYMHVCTPETEMHEGGDNRDAEEDAPDRCAVDGVERDQHPVGGSGSPVTSRTNRCVQSGSDDEPGAGAAKPGDAESEGDEMWKERAEKADGFIRWILTECPEALIAVESAGRLPPVDNLTELLPMPDVREKVFERLSQRDAIRNERSERAENYLGQVIDLLGRANDEIKSLGGRSIYSFSEDQAEQIFQRGRARSNGHSAAAPSGAGKNIEAARIDSFTDAGYELLKARLLADQAVLARLNALRPTIELQIERRAVQMGGESLKGRFALLAHEGFFKSPRPAGDVLREAQRRGWMNQNNRSNHVAIPLAELMELGILTREDAGYQIAPGARIVTKGA